MTFNWWDALEREEAWWETDTLASFPTALPLQIANGGLFEKVSAKYPTTPIKTGRHLYLVRDWLKPQEQLGWGTNNMHWRHRMVAIIFWTFREAPGAAEDAMMTLEKAIASVLDRIAGPIGDKSHGGAFDSVGQPPDDNPQVWFAAGNPYEALASREPTEVQITYGIDDLPFNN